MTTVTNIRTALENAKAAGDAAALAQFDRDGRQDCGSCGGSIIMLDRRMKFTTVAINLGLARDLSGDVFVVLDAPEGVRTQNATVQQEQARAWRKSIEAAGFGKAIKKAWDYVD